MCLKDRLCLCQHEALLHGHLQVCRIVHIFSYAYKLGYVSVCMQLYYMAIFRCVRYFFTFMFLKESASLVSELQNYAS
jgi:hypothetical protein